MMKIHIQPNFINQQDCQTIINFINKSNIQYGEVLNRRTIRFGIDRFNGTTESLNNAEELEPLLRVYAAKATNLINQKFETSKEIYVSTMWLSKQVAGSKIMAHSDLDGGINSQYTHSGIIYLNTQISGGELFFPKLNKEFKPNTGDFISFEARSKEALHGVHMATQDRYAIPIWFTDDENYKLS